MSYIQGFLIAVPKAKKQAYHRLGAGGGTDL